MKQKTTKYKTVMLILLSISVIFNLAAFSRTFCDRYTDHVYPRLAGYYPPVKNSLFSDILERMNVGGMALGYTMELVRNKYSGQPLFLPVLDAHEMTHYKGFYRESEAEFIGTLALIRSDDPYLRLAGYLEIDKYMDLAMRAAQDAAAAELEEAGKVTPIPEGMTLHDPGFKELLRKQAAEIQQYLKERPYFSERTGALIDQSNGIAAEIYQEDSHPIDNMPAVNEAIGEIADVGWETQAAVLKEHNYDGMALLYLQYFDGKLYGEGTEK